MVREGALNLEVPEALGLPASAGRGQWNLNRAQAATKDALIAGDVDVIRQIAFDLFLCGHSLAKVCDSVLAPAMREIGALWEANDVDVYQERRATLLISRVLHHLQQSLSRPLRNAPLALGGAPTGDPYALCHERRRLEPSRDQGATRDALVFLDRLLMQYPFSEYAVEAEV
ncbi:MAG: B12-binding domain-containing protein, partial [Planctomycetota bacterium]